MAKPKCASANTKTRTGVLNGFVTIKLCELTLRSVPILVAIDGITPQNTGKVISTQLLEAKHEIQIPIDGNPCFSAPSLCSIELSWCCISVFATHRRRRANEAKHRPHSSLDYMTPADFARQCFASVACAPSAKHCRKDEGNQANFNQPVLS